MQRKIILTEEQSKMKLRRMAFQLEEHNRGEAEVYLIGIRESGYHIAQLLGSLLSELTALNVQVHPMTIDKRSPLNCTLPDGVELNNKAVVLVDDVVNSGKTMLYALIPLLNAAPKKIQTLTLVERSYKTFPVHVDFVGLSLSTTLQDHITVELQSGSLPVAYLH
ncbi:MAG: phosphoribosyltransferase family protein [Bacteroidota bacterium]